MYTHSSICTIFLNHTCTWQAYTYDTYPIYKMQNISAITRQHKIFSKITQCAITAWTYNLREWYLLYTVGQKKRDTLLLSVSLPVIDWFWKFFHRHTLQTIWLYTMSQKNIPDIFDCNVKKDYWNLIIFGTNIPETACHQVTI